MDKKQNKENSNIRLAFFLNLGFTIVEIVGGITINSIAIISDAIHDLGDTLSLGLAWFLGYYSEKKEDKNYTYGYRRYSLLAALINTTVLIIGSFIIFYNAIPRLFNPQSTNATGMIGFAVLGILVNGLAVFKTKGGHSLNEKVVSWHLLEDVLGWIAVLVVGIIMYFKDIPILDPILSIIITFYILYNVIINFKKTILLFLQAVPENIDLNKIIKRFEKIDKVISTHHTHIWSLDSEYHVLTTHLVVDKSASLDDLIKIKEEARKKIQDLNMEHITIEFDFNEKNCTLGKKL
ncbi:MAG: cation diffusion facilitator family transporter [Tissierella sp.]|uniref:cation diffusion facilitator family transporter n=1 Tax=Tissierella sp. TaxID=41274 RepID=UPI003F983D8C